jgi:hypothetical protein
MIIIANKYLIPRGYTAIAIYPFIILRKKEYSGNTVLINHEKIHLHQQAELLWLFFFIWYVLEFLIRFIALRNRKAAYKNICLEKEAYAMEQNLEYLKARKMFSFLKFL